MYCSVTNSGRWALSIGRAVNATDVRLLIHAMAQQVTPHLPTGMSLREVQGYLVLSTPLGSDCFLLEKNIQDNMSLGASEAIRTSVLSTMNELQDVVSEVTTRPWPERDSNVQSGFAIPRAEIIGQHLVLWFETAGDDPRFPKITILVPFL
jgi:hypothetical protein